MAPKSGKPQAHGLTHGQMKELQEAQINGEEFEQIKGNVDSSYNFDAHEKGFVHARLQNPGFDQTTGKQLDAGIVQKYTPREFKNHESNNGFAGKKVTILHNPDKGEIAAPKVAASGNGPIPADIPLDKLNKVQLQAKYKELYGEDANGLLNKSELIKLIDEKVLFLQEEAKAGQNNNTVDKNEDQSGEDEQHESLV